MATAPRRLHSRLSHMLADPSRRELPTRRVALKGGPPSPSLPCLGPALPGPPKRAILPRQARIARLGIPPAQPGKQLVKALERAGWHIARQRGSQVRMKHPDRRTPVTVPLHRELKRGTLSAILNDAGLDPEQLRRSL